MKPLVFVASSRKDLASFPAAVRSEVGYALYLAQQEELHHRAKTLRGLPVVEIVMDHDRSAYRAVYTAKFADAIYVLHAFQKKSTRGSATPKPDMNLIRERLKVVTEARRGDRIK
jgi:phage-related protein